MNQHIKASLQKSQVLNWQNWIFLLVFILFVIPVLDFSYSYGQKLFQTYAPLTYFIAYDRVTPDKSVYGPDEEIVGVSYKYQRGGYVHSFVSRLLCDTGNGFTEYSRQEWSPYVVEEFDYREIGKRWRYDKATPRDATCYIRSTVCVHLPRLKNPRCEATPDTPWFRILEEKTK